MKKILFIFITFSLISGAFSQKRIPANISAKDYKITLEIDQYFDGSEQLSGTVPYKSSNKLIDEDQAGETFYDRQSNAGLGNRFFLYEDGTMGATWTIGLDVSAFADRGTGYNYFDGEAWGDWPTNRIESIKTGWPSYTDLGENGEINAAHNAGAPYGMHVNLRNTKGTGDWTETILLGPPDYEKITWPRLLTSGENNDIIHMLAEIRDIGNGGYQGQDYALAYYRSMDGGESWDITNQVFEELGPDYYSEIGPDTYTWAEPKNGIIAFASMGKWHDVILMKSDDNGDSWDKTVVWEHPYPFYGDETVFTDTLWGCDHSGNISLDSEGKAHLVFGLGFYTKTEVGTTYTLWPTLSNGIVYWNEDMPPFEAENQHDALDPEESLIEDYNLIGWMHDENENGQLDFVDDQNVFYYGQIGLVCMPNIMIDENNKIFVTYAATSELYYNQEYNFKHIWVRTSADNGNTWLDHFDITSDITHSFDECIYPQLAKNSDDNIYLMYNVDYTPGLAVLDDHPYEQNRMYVATIPKADIVIGMDENTSFTSENVSQCFPNPASDISTIIVELNRAQKVHIELINLVGQIVYKIPEQELNKGSHSLFVDVSNLDPGIYIYTVYANNQKVNKKLIVE